MLNYALISFDPYTRLVHFHLLCKTEEQCLIEMIDFLSIVVLFIDVECSVRIFLFYYMSKKSVI